MDWGMDHNDWPRLSVMGSVYGFTARRVWCIGRNYVDHAKEMGDTGTKPPLVFAKHPCGLVPVRENEAARIRYPSKTEDLHHEVELVLAIGEGGGVIGSAVGLDMTRRDLQLQMKDRRGPWTIGKDFLDSAPIGPIVLGDPPVSGRIALTVDGVVRQHGDVSLMMHGPEALVSRVNAFCPLQAGDLIFTGTPSGVGSVTPGQVLEATIEGLPPLIVHVDG